MDEFLNTAWRLNNLYSIVDKNSNKITFLENSIQREINKNKSRRKAILKARQFGISTNELLKMFDFVLWNDNVTACIIAHEQDAIKKLFRIIRRAYNFLDEDIKPELDRGGGSLYEMYFPEHNSRIYVDLSSRSDTINYLHVSEAAFIKDTSRILATLQAVPINGRVTLETTPNGVGGYFYDEWFNKGSTYSKVFVPWYLHSEYKLETTSEIELSEDEIKLKHNAKNKYGIELSAAQFMFRRFKQQELKRLFYQEYPEDDAQCFLSSGSPAVDLAVINEMISVSREPIEEKGFIRIHKRVEKNKGYVIGADPAEGIGGDKSCAVVMDTKTLEIVAMAHGQIKPADFARVIKELGLMYKVKDLFPLAGVERNNHGHAVLLELNDHLYYPRIFKDKDERLGWKTDVISRPLMIDTLIKAIEAKRIIIPDSTILNEFLTLVEIDKKIQANVGKNDDTIIATAIALQLAQANRYGVSSKIYV